ncbi:MAG: HD domain-containing protein [Planctomycetota bacterium]|nr:HD domain-containing protein [Planctomycetota bacterium]
MSAPEDSPRLAALLGLAPLADLPRTGWLQAGLAPGLAVESVAAHAHLTTLLAMALAPAVEPPLDLGRCLALCTVHDLAEAGLGDLPRAGSRALPPGAKASAEAQLVLELTEGLGPGAAVLRQHFEDYAAAGSREARFTKLCDKLQMGLRALVLARAGHRGMGAFGASVAALDCSEFPPCDALRGEIEQQLASK